MENTKKNYLFLTFLVSSLPIHVLSEEITKFDKQHYLRAPGVHSSGWRYHVDGHKSGSGLIEDDPSVVDPVCLDMDFSKIRDMFPITKSIVHNYPLIFFDSGATAQMPQMVLDAIVEYYDSYKSNVGRGLYTFAEKATRAYELARAKIARFIGAKTKEIVFTSGATAGINLVAHMWVQQHVQEGDEIIISEVEHNANFIPWQQLAMRKGVVVKRVPLNDRGVVDVEVFKTYVTEKTKFVAITHTSNILGSTNDIAALAKVAHEVGAKLLVDAAQSVAHQKIDVATFNCDFLVFSGHKLFGPTGIGVLFVKEDLFDQCELQNFGGGMVYDVFVDETEFKEWPHCIEPGTGAIAQAIGLGAAIDFVQRYINFEQLQQHETTLVCKLADALKQLPGVTIISVVPKEGEHNNMVTFKIDGYHAYGVAEYLDTCGIAVRAGFHCVQPYHDKLGGDFSIRATFTAYNTEQEVEFFVECLKRLLN